MDIQTGSFAETGMPKSSTSRLAGALGLCLLALLLATGPAAAAEGVGSLALSGLTLKAGPKPALGDTLKIEFTLTNHGPAPVPLDDKQGTFVLAAVKPAGSRQTISRVIGQSYQGWRLKPGQSLVVNIEQLLDMPGAWRLVPGYQAGGRRVLFDKLARTIEVSVVGQASAGASGGAGLIKLKVLSYNCALPQQRMKAGLNDLMKIVSSQGPDLMAMQEVTEDTARRAAQDGGLKHVAMVRAYGQAKWRVKRVALLSRWPMNAKPVKLPGGAKPRTVLRAEVDIGGVPLVFWAVHFIREGLVDGHLKGILKEVVGGGLRMEEMEALVARIKEDRHRFIIVAGDMNTFPLSAPYRLLAGVLEDAFHDLLTTGTYRLSMLRQGMGQGKAGLMKAVPDPKIDHIFHSRAIMDDGAWVIKQGQSDHYPIAARLALPLEAKRPGTADIQRAQAALARAGLLPADDVTGQLNPPTRRAIAKLQEREGLAIDGLLQGEVIKMLLH